MSSTLFAHLAMRFGTHPENLATEALGYILRRSSAARDRLPAILSEYSTNLPALQFQNQVAGDDGARPDLAGIDSFGMQRALIEAKFWAGLTSGQPVAYLDRLPADGLLLFVVPEARLDLVWSELQMRCVDAGRRWMSAPAGDNRRAACVDGRSVAIVSWRSLLSSLKSATDREGERETSADLEQLTGLCDEVDASAFLPVRSDELSSGAHRRVIEFVDLLDRILAALEAQGVAKRTGRLSSGGTWTGQQVVLTAAPSAVANIFCDLRQWTRVASTPYWLRVGRGAGDALSRALTVLDKPVRRVFDDEGRPYVALFVKVGAEADVIIDDIVRQVREVASIAAAILVDSVPGTASPPTEAATATSPAAVPEPEAKP